MNALEIAVLIQALIGLALGVGILSVKRDYNMGSKSVCFLFLAGFTVYAGWYIATGTLCLVFVVFAALSHGLCATTTQRS